MTRTEWTTRQVLGKHGLPWKDEPQAPLERDEDDAYYYGYGHGLLIGVLCSLPVWALLALVLWRWLR
jgi:hypothetical protein